MIYIWCPAAGSSGGPELLHQLGYKLRLLGIPTNMLYWSWESTQERLLNPVVPQYKKYEVPFITTRDIEKRKNFFSETDCNIIYEGIIEKLEEVEGTNRYLWWLSVDNACMNDKKRELIEAAHDVIHLTQSVYADDYVRNVLQVSSERVHYLSDYINSTFLIPDRISVKKEIILYNPKKGFEFTRELIKHSADKFLWEGVEGMDPQEVHEVMQSAKVYIDFGNHPGKDRIPREALLSGCLVITNRNGSAGYEEDVPIPECYKIDDGTDYYEIIEKIEDLLENYDENWKLYQEYLQKTEREFLDFEKDIYIVFGKYLSLKEKCMSPNSLISEVQSFLEKGELLAAYRNLVLYYVLGYPKNVMFWKLEATLRFRIKEYQEAIWCAQQMLRITN